MSYESIRNAIIEQLISDRIDAQYIHCAGIPHKDLQWLVEAHAERMAIPFYLWFNEDGQLVISLNMSAFREYTHSFSKEDLHRLNGELMTQFMHGVSCITEDYPEYLSDIISNTHQKIMMCNMQNYQFFLDDNFDPKPCTISFDTEDHAQIMFFDPNAG